MSLTREEKVIRLRRGIASNETSEALRSIMQADLNELLKPEPVYVDPPVVKAKQAVKKAVKVKKEAPVIETKAPEPPALTQEDKDRLKEEIQRNLAKKKAKQAEEN